MTESIIKLYRPSNGTEGDIFISQWCCNCARDKSFSEGVDVDLCSADEICQIINKTMAYDIDHEEYPREWQYNAKGAPICTAFRQTGENVKYRCEKTLDMFEEAPQ